MKIYIGIDPGLTGAVASITSEGRFVEVHDAPVVTFSGTARKDYDDDEMAGILRAMVSRGIALVAIEAQRSMPGQGVASMLKLGLGYGLWRGVIAGLRLPCTLVQPRQWIKDMNAGKEKVQRVLIAKRLFPAVQQLTKTKHGRADALLIAEWARRFHSVNRVKGQ